MFQAESPPSYKDRPPGANEMPCGVESHAGVTPNGPKFRVRGARDAPGVCLSTSVCLENDYSAKALSPSHPGEVLHVPGGYRQPPGAGTSAKGRRTTAIVEMAQAAGVLVEAELEHIPLRGESAQAALTDPELPGDFVARTGLDLLAVAIGSVRALKSRSAHWDLARLRAIQRETDGYLTLHGEPAFRMRKSAGPFARAAPRSATSRGHPEPPARRCETCGVQRERPRHTPNASGRRARRSRPRWRTGWRSLLSEAVVLPDEREHDRGH